jgi:hypothetical protein
MKAITPITPRQSRFPQPLKGLGNGCPAVINPHTTPVLRRTGRRRLTSGWRRVPQRAARQP